jgi:SAM-dependent methyltransferase
MRNRERGTSTVPTRHFGLRVRCRCVANQLLGRRRFEWVSSTDPGARSRLDQLSAAMIRFYSQEATREAYQAMIDAPESAQPALEGALRGAILREACDNVLEVGCGSGRIYRRLRCEGLRARYTGIEMADHVIADNRARFPEAQWIAGNGYALPVAPESQDCIFAYYVLEHCVYPERFLKRLLASLKPGGRLLLTFPDMIASGIFGSQALGWDRSTAKEHLRQGRLLHAVVRLWDTRLRLPRALRHATTSVGPFPVNLLPQCLETGIEPQPDYDAVYLASRREVEAWAKARGLRVSYPAGQRELAPNALIEIVK